MKEFDLIRAPLTGRTLIEANAGTGKTYAMVGLFIRMILERGLLPRQIVVVTFTKAATAELKERILSQLTHCLDILDGRAENPDPNLVEICQRLDDRTRARHQLSYAVRTLDMAVIQTIHGFCQRILVEFGMLAGAPSAFDVVVDDQNLILPFVEQIWQQLSGTFSDGFASYLNDAAVNLENTCHQVLAIQQHPGLTVISEAPESSSLAAMERNLISEIDSIAQDGEGEYPSKVVGVTHGWRRYQRFPKLSVVRGWSKKDGRLTAAREQAEELYRAYQSHYKHLVFEVAQKAGRTLRLEKRRLGIKTYQDLLADVHQAVVVEQREELIDAIRGRFPVALVDEFQDTDPIQFEIFQRLYREPSQTLILVGDPKQAIYSFRGADVFAYLNSRDWVDRQYSLSVNWRSTATLVDQVNRLFGVSDAPFLLDGLEYLPSRPAVATQYGNPLTIWQFDEYRSSDAAERVSQHIAMQIARRLERGEPPADIAVLARDRRQIGLVATALKQFNIPVSVSSAASLFQTTEALELVYLMRAMLNPASDAVLLAALGSSLIGFSAAQLSELGDDGLEDWRKKFSVATEVWEAHGAGAGLNELLGELGLYSNMLATAEGRQTLKVWQQLITWAQNQGGEPEMLHKRLQDYVLDGVGAGEDFEQLYADSETGAVKVMTMHASKGLQFPVVYCPFVWQAKSPRLDDMGALFHDPERGNQLVADLSSSSKSVSAELAKKEKRADEIRLLYVALTRAERECELVVADNKESPFHKMLDADLPKARSDGQRSALLKEIGCELKPISPDLAAVPELMTMAATPLQLPLPRAFSGRIPGARQLLSFSGIMAGQDTETIDHGDWLTGRARNDTGLSGGTATGNLAHAVLENLAGFDADQAEIQRVLEATMLPGDLEADQHPAFGALIENTLTTPLDRAEPGLTLQCLQPHQYVREMPFWFQMRDRSSTRLLEAAGLTDSGHSMPGDVMQGYIDLVFRHEGQYFLLDYKTNFLGDSIEDYRPDALQQAVRQSGYQLQYLIYTLGLCSYLQRIQPDFEYQQDFGGVYYLFMRGMHPTHGPEFGVFHNKPEQGLFDELMTGVVQL